MLRTLNPATRDMPRERKVTSDKNEKCGKPSEVLEIGDDRLHSVLDRGVDGVHVLRVTGKGSAKAATEAIAEFFPADVPIVVSVNLLPQSHRSTLIDVMVSSAAVAVVVIIVSIFVICSVLVR